MGVTHFITGMPITSGAPCPSACGLALPPPGPGLQPLWEVPGNRTTGPFSRPPRIPLAPRAPSAGQARFKDGPRGVTARLGPGPGDPAHEARRRAARPPVRLTCFLDLAGHFRAAPEAEAAAHQAPAGPQRGNRPGRPPLSWAAARRASHSRRHGGLRAAAARALADRAPARTGPAAPPLHLPRSRRSGAASRRPQRRAAARPPAWAPRPRRHLPEARRAASPAPQRPLLARSRDKPGERRSTPCRPGVVPTTDQHGPHLLTGRNQAHKLRTFASSPHGRCRTF